MTARHVPQGMWAAWTGLDGVDQIVAEIAARGFTLIVNNGVPPDAASVEAFVDACDRHGARGCIPANCADEGAKHKAVWGYIVGDDDATGKATAMNTAYVAFHGRPGQRTITSKYIWGAYTVRSQFAHLGMCSHIAADIYPVGGTHYPIRLAVRELSRLAKRRKQVPACNLQAFSWSQDAVDRGQPPTRQPFPTREQMRHQRDEAIAGGAELLLWFDYYFAKPAGKLDDVAWAAFG